VTTEHAVGHKEQLANGLTEGVVDKTTNENEPGRGRRVLRWWRAKWLPLTTAVLLVAALALTAGMYRYQYWQDQQTDARVAHEVVQAAANGTVVIVSYSPDSLDRDFATAKSHLTGDFLSYYSQFTDQVVAPAAKQKGIRTTARIVKAAVSELHRDQAVVLIFVNQPTTSTAQPQQKVTASSVLVTLTKVNGSWLISKFDPV
jgi:Mce-associated membrane protein